MLSAVDGAIRPAILFDHELLAPFNRFRSHLYARVDLATLCIIDELRGGEHLANESRKLGNGQNGNAADAALLAILSRHRLILEKHARARNQRRVLGQLDAGGEELFAEVNGMGLS